MVDRIAAGHIVVAGTHRIAVDGLDIGLAELADHTALVRNLAQMAGSSSPFDQLRAELDMAQKVVGHTAGMALGYTAEMALGYTAGSADCTIATQPDRLERERHNCDKNEHQVGLGWNIRGIA